jgi:hypothetical protein
VIVEILSALMDDRRAQFLITIGDMCLAANLAGLVVRVRSRDGSEGAARGVPYLREGIAGEAAGGIGHPRILMVDGRLVDPEEIVECTICAPEAPERR